MSPTGSAERLAVPAPERPPATAEEMVARCRPAIERAAFKMAHPSIREDVVQDALLRVFTHFRKCRTNPEGWATSIVFNLLRHNHREGKRDRKFLKEEGRKDEARPSAPKAELMALVDRAFFDLSPLQQEALKIYIVEEIPERDAADMMGISWGSYRALIHRARQSLLKRLRAHLKGSGLLGELERFA